jgi:hypothetical protein
MAAIVTERAHIVLMGIAALDPSYAPRISRALPYIRKRGAADSQ